MKQLWLILVLSMHSLAFAHCPGPVPCEMKYVDNAFGKTTKTGAELEKAKAMREEGERLFKEGKEDEALKILKEAKKLYSTESANSNTREIRHHYFPYYPSSVVTHQFWA